LVGTRRPDLGIRKNKIPDLVIAAQAKPAAHHLDPREAQLLDMLRIRHRPYPSSSPDGRPILRQRAPHRDGEGIRVGPAVRIEVWRLPNI
jgi:hypothetical protein